MPPLTSIDPLTYALLLVGVLSLALFATFLAARRRARADRASDAFWIRFEASARVARMPNSLEALDCVLRNALELRPTRMSERWAAEVLVDSLVARMTLVRLVRDTPQTPPKLTP